MFVFIVRRLTKHINFISYFPRLRSFGVGDRIASQSFRCEASIFISKKAPTIVRAFLVIIIITSFMQYYKTVEPKSTPRQCSLTKAYRILITVLLRSDLVCIIKDTHATQFDRAYSLRAIRCLCCIVKYNGYVPDISTHNILQSLYNAIYGVLRCVEGNVTKIYIIVV